MSAVLQPNQQLEVQFEPLTVDRLDRVLSIEQAVYAHPWSLANFTDSVTAGYQMQVLTAATADAAGERPILGYFVAMQGYEEVHLLNITVAPEYQGQGWARVMLDALAVWSRGLAADWLWLEVRASNTRALKVYQDHGFKLVSVRLDYYPAGPKANGREDAIVMSLKL
ncbi:MAG: ribosomal protein S18-alanine N-acetyltransferase [Burkholderiaceae bacterium]|nr:ribosomal protein S18-alanine N-acetyltransferase [Burkholderiaceae bacterium]